jgi:phenylalanyl-tRNA synthetase alpha chain
VENVAWIEEIRSQATRDIELADSEAALEDVRIRYLGRSGRITRAFRDVAAAPPEERPQLGQSLNQLKDYVELALARRRDTLGQAVRAALGVREGIDVTLPGRPLLRGRAHVLSRAAHEMSEIFRGMGFDVEDGPEVERDHDNFERLNIPPYHPARDAQDSFYLDDVWLLRTHATVVDVHVMDARRPPIRAVSTGHCYRRDPVDASHSPMFQQIDGFIVDEGVRFSDL